jgi:hypothetical protein
MFEFEEPDFEEDVALVLLALKSTVRPIDPLSFAPVQGHLIRCQSLAIVEGVTPGILDRYLTERTRGSVGVFPEIGIYSGPIPLTNIPRSKSTTICFS